MHALTPQNVVSHREQVYFVIALVIATVIWTALTLATFGMIWIILAIFGIIVWFSNGLLVASLKTEAVAVHPPPISTS